MRPVARFTVTGRPTPWSVPHIGTGRTRAGRRYRFTTRNPRLDSWQKAVRTAARLAMRGLPPHVGPLLLKLEFTFVTAVAGKGQSLGRPGTPWSPEVAWDDARRAWRKRGRSTQMPDLTNLVKGTEDALEGICCGNDAQHVMILASRFVGRQDAVRVTVLALDPADFPGESP